MPVIVVGADTSVGRAAVTALLRREGEVRAFVTDPSAAADLKEQGAKTAIGDVSDASHIEGAAIQCFSAVLITEAARDDRVRSFAATPEAVMDGWAQALAEAGVRRAIWVGGQPPAPGAPEVGVVPAAGRDSAAIAEEIAALDEAATL